MKTPKILGPEDLLGRRNELVTVAHFWDYDETRIMMSFLAINGQRSIADFDHYHKGWASGIGNRLCVAPEDLENTKMILSKAESLGLALFNFCPSCGSENVGEHHGYFRRNFARLVFSLLPFLRPLQQMQCNDCPDVWNVPTAKMLERRKK